MVNSRSPCARDAWISQASEGGAFFHTRVGTPSIVSVSISNMPPGAVRIASASASDIFGQAGSSAINGSVSKVHLLHEIARRPSTAMT